MVRVQALEFVNHEQAVLADEPVVEPDFAAAVFRAHDEHQVPVDGGIVAVRGFLVAHARRKVDAARNLLVKEDVAHRRVHERVETDGELAHVACALVGIKDGIELRIVARFAGGIHNLPVLEFQADVAELLALVKRGSIVVDYAVDAATHRCGILSRP